MLAITEPAERPATPARISYAQNLEDILLDRLFRGRIGTFVDIGANHPFVDSNTYFFYLRGWRGVNLEPNPGAIDLFRAYRPEDRNLAVAVSDAEGTLPFFEVTSADGSTGLSTLQRALADAYRSEEGYDVRELAVPVRTLAALITEHAIEPPDLVSIDVEGHESAVIRGLPFESWRPKVLVIESTVPLSGRSTHRDWEPRVQDHGYLFATFNGVNRFYLRDDLADELHHFETPVSVLDQYLRHDLVAARNCMDEYRDRYEREKADRAFEQARHEELRRAWEWGQVQARHAQAVWEQECASFARERQSWKGALEHFDRTQAEFDRQRAEFESQRAEFESRRATWEAERASLEGQLAEARRMLRPYRLVDRMGLVETGYTLARRLAGRAAS